MITEVQIPKRSVFKSTEVCRIAGVQPYILRSWEAEFSKLARSRTKGGARVYRRADVEMVLQIKALVYGEGLTLGAAHRKLDAGEESVPGADTAEGTLLVGLFDSDARDRIVGVKHGLRGILDLLSPNNQTAKKPATAAKTAGPAKTLTTVKVRAAEPKPKNAAKRKRSA
jgi:DNA-binding transcriptional MerR regulator